MRASCSDYDGSSYREVKALWHMPVQTILDSQICRQSIKASKIKICFVQFSTEWQRRGKPACQ